jgi:cysteine desulfurase family protein
MTIYFDNAATSYPKPERVLRTMEEYFLHVGANSGRSAHRRSQQASKTVFETREKIAKLIGADDSSRIVFTLNATEGLNMVILHALKDGDKVITTSIEHNSVMRPLRYMEREKNVTIEVVKCSIDGKLKPSDLKKHITRNTNLIVTTAASNVTGTILPVPEIAAIARQNGVPLLVDAAQITGKIPVDVTEHRIDFLAFSGHKGLMGPQGTGCLYVREGLDIDPLKFGGTGSRSETEDQPDFCPDKYESGTLNIIGIAGLGAGVDFILEEGVAAIRDREERLTRYLLQSMREIPGITIYGPKDAVDRIPVVSFNVEGRSSSEVGGILDGDFNIAVRCGLHCSPAAHRTIGTFPQGTVRAGLGYFNTEDEIDYFRYALSRIVE